MKKYEYIARASLNQDDLNILGQEGWELISVNQNIYIFKRDIVEVKIKKK